MFELPLAGVGLDVSEAGAGTGAFADFEARRPDWAWDATAATRNNENKATDRAFWRSRRIYV